MPIDADQLRSLLTDLSQSDPASRASAQARNDQLTKPPGALGRLEELAIWLAGWQATTEPILAKVQTLVFAGNHGVVARGVSAFPAEVTEQMVANFSHGGAAINQLCTLNNAELEVCALDLDRPTRDFCAAAAMDWPDFLSAVRTGVEKVDPHANLLCIGEMGIGNTTVAAAICHALYGGDAADWVGRGTGVDDAGLKRKSDVISTAVQFHHEHLHDPLEIARRLGGRELAAIAGAVLAARQHRIPVLMDGFVATAALAPFHQVNPTFLDHCAAAHCSVEPGHRRLLEKLAKQPLLDLDMRLGEGSGAVVAVAILRAAIATYNGMATFAEAGVAGKSG